MQTSTVLKQTAPAPAVRGRRIAIFVDDLSATGVVRNAIAIANRLHTEGWEACVVASRAEGTLRSGLVEGIPVRQLIDDGSSPPSRRTRLIRSFKYYRRFLKSFRPDVLLSAGNHGHWPTILAAKAVPGCRTVFRISNDIEHRSEDTSRKGLRGLGRRLKLKLVSDYSDLMVVVSPHLLGHPVIASAHSAGKVALIPNGVDVDEVRERAQGHCDHPWLADDAEEPFVLGVGRLVRQKNFKALIRALALARGAKPLRLLIIGSGPLQEELECEAARLGIGESVAIIPPVANPMPYMARAAVVAVPSWWEGSSNVLLEALACGTPVVASETAGSARLVLDEGRYGALVDPANVDQIAAALLRQCSEFAALPSIRARDFSIDEALDAYSSAISDLVEAPVAAR